MEVDGEPAPIVPVDGALIGVFVPPGQHTVTLDYLPGAANFESTFM